MAEALVSLRVVKTIVGLLGIIGNWLVCVVIYRVRSMHTLTNAFIANQAVVDFLGSLMLLLSSNVPTPYPLDQDLASWLLCRLWVSDILVWAFFTASTFNLVALTLERYYAIVFPFRYQRNFQSCKATVVIACVWVFGMATCAYGIVIHVINEGGRCVQIAVPGAHAIGVLYLCMQYFLPASVMFFAYSHIAIVLKRNATRVGPMQARRQDRAGGSVSGQPAGEGAGDAMLRARRNTIKTLVLVFAVYVVCWTPSSVIFFMYNFGWPLDFRGALYIISTSMVAINSCANPFIYALKYQQFRRGVRSMLGLTQDAGQETTAHEMHSYSTGSTAAGTVSAQCP
ncbi:galanin receptor 2b-like [Patiria miniata]|uniref:G-protein coupled receptors family 1 profile domain-containing protein n=1 Tax=Patiria miniata TaxID=46514 RepID=A0A913ZIE2_PATMI|nr:galanin receptor 2b-like [Patiria miniata]